MIQGFKEFVLRGNVIDLAVAVVIGAAFTGIVNAIVTGLINPLIALIFRADSLNDLVWSIPNIRGGETDFGWGMIIGAIINFIAVAVVVYFVFVYPLNRAKERAAAKAGIAAEEASSLPTEQELLLQIRDLLAKDSSKA
ncbi:MAG TPA: large conductance mechanosensitive channel protein MscL [Microbacterium sp.]|uniref:large conductance mechanosensitive channel protein MscL n=1 Tax=Microbacterium sp. TaxID=51671 RepID=UPI002CFDE1D4|nr:large conductance mechanosensitive channel protein MscL [Microbacterium sp.]HWI30332.1 large conductance mechanosensitive channel protein MscL [Microbacterium sp.]